MDSLAATKEVEDFIDESLYSRQLYNESGLSGCICLGMYWGMMPCVK